MERLFIVKKINKFVMLSRISQQRDLLPFMIEANVVPRPPRTEMVKQKRSRVKAGLGARTV